jgi:hypothetical protein
MGLSLNPPRSDSWLTAYHWTKAKHQKGTPVLALESWQPLASAGYGTIVGLASYKVQTVGKGFSSVAALEKGLRCPG